VVSFSSPVLLLLPGRGDSGRALLLLLLLLAAAVLV
jgi:hypothetical protein